MKDPYLKLKRKQGRMIDKLKKDNPKKNIKEFMYGITVGKEEK